MSSQLQKLLTRNPVTPDRAYAVTGEQEPDGVGGVADVTTIFLTASACPIGCNMCDLWQNTLSAPTPLGAIPSQIDTALVGRECNWLKLYNSGNFFDPASIPPNDYAAIANRCEPYSRIVVENHPSFGRQRLQQFRDLLSGQLEVAVGLETVQPGWLSRLGKKMSRDEFDRYARWLKEQATDLRVFLIVGVPGSNVSEAIRWARLSARHACKIGARHISLIPARAGHGWNGLAAQLPNLTASVLFELQQMVLDDLQSRAVVTIDAWDLEPDSSFVEKIKQQNLWQRAR